MKGPKQCKQNLSCSERRKSYENIRALAIKHDLTQRYEKASGKRGVVISSILPPAALLSFFSIALWQETIEGHYWVFYAMLYNHFSHDIQCLL